MDAIEGQPKIMTTVAHETLPQQQHPNQLVASRWCPPGQDQLLLFILFLSASFYFSFPFRVTLPSKGNSE